MLPKTPSRPSRTGLQSPKKCQYDPKTPSSQNPNMGIKTTQNPKPIRNLLIKMQKFANKKLQAKEVCKIEVWLPTNIVKNTIWHPSAGESHQAAKITAPHCYSPHPQPETPPPPPFPDKHQNSPHPRVQYYRTLKYFTLYSTVLKQLIAKGNALFTYFSQQRRDLM